MRSLVKFSCLLTISLLLLGHDVHSARILGVFPTPSISHQVVYQPIWRELALRGHDLVVMTPNPLEDASLTNLREINWKKAYKTHDEYMNSLTAPPVGKEFFNNLLRITKIINEEQLSHPEVKQLINNKTAEFDLVLVEWMFPTMFAFSERFRCPMIGIMSMPPSLPAYDAVGNPSHPVYNPDFPLPFGLELNLVERVLSTLFSVWYRLYHRLVIIPESDDIVAKHFGENMRSLYEIERDISLLIVNKHPVLHNIRPNVPAVVELSGFHLKPNKPLPKEIQNYLDDAPEGVVYFSLGSNVKSSSLLPEKLGIIVEALSELPYKVLWKWETDEFPGKPDNVKISKWLPQQDVLAHPNVKAFVTQGGIQSLEEAIHNRVPVLGIPFFGDQKSNIKRILSHDLGLLVDFDYLTKESLKDGIIEIVTNKRYKENMEILASLAEDQPIKALDLAVWWIEYVIRHNGAKHLRSPSIDIPWYQYLLLDVIAVITVIILLLSIIINKLTRYVIIGVNIVARKLFSGKTKTN